MAETTTFLKSLPWKWILIVGGSLVVLYIIWKQIQKAQQAKNYNEAISQAQTSINQLAQQGVKPTYGQAQYSGWANSMQQALDGCGGGWTTQQGIWSKLLNKADVYSLISAYGVRKIDKCGVGTGDFEGDLNASLAYKFSGVEGDVIEGSIDKINAILKANNSENYTF